MKSLCSKIFSLIVLFLSLTLLAVLNFTVKSYADGSVAEINGVEYSSLDDALSAAENETVVLLSDIELDDIIYVECSTSIDFNGHKITADGNGYIINLESDCQLTLSDSVGGGGLFDFYDYAFVLNSDCILDINGGVYYSDSCQYLINSLYDYSFSVSGGYFSTEYLNSTEIILNYFIGDEGGYSYNVEAYGYNFALGIPYVETPPVQSYSVSYYLEESELTPACIDETEGGNVKLIPSVTLKKRGFKLIGWKIGGVCYSLNDLILINQDTDVYCIWQQLDPSSITYTIKFSTNGVGSVSHSEIYCYENVPPFIATELNTLTVDGITVTAEAHGENQELKYDFNNWSVSYSGKEILVKANYDIEYVLYSVKLYNYDNSLIETIYVRYGQSVDVGEWIPPAKPSDEYFDYTFSGWVTELGGSTAADLSNICSETNIYAAYSSANRRYTINYICDGVIISGEHYSYEYGTEKTLPVPARAGYTFLGWTSEPGATEYFTTVTADAHGNLTFYANWQINTYTVCFYGTTDSEEPLSLSGDYGTSVPYQSLNFRKYFRDDDYSYTFAGWKDSGGQPCSPVTFESDLNLYAEFTRKKLVAAPPQANVNFTYSGQTINYIPENFDGAYMKISGNTAIRVGNYSAIVTLDDRIAEWREDGVTDCVCPFSISAARINCDVNNYSGTYDAGERRVSQLLNVSTVGDCEYTLFFKNENGEWTNDDICFLHATNDPVTVHFKIVAANHEDYSDSVNYFVEHVKLKISIDSKKSKIGNELAELTYAISEGQPLTGEDLKIELSCSADIYSVGITDITGVCNNPDYKVEFVDGKYEVYEVAIDIFFRDYSDTVALLPQSVDKANAKDIISMYEFYLTLEESEKQALTAQQIENIVKLNSAVQKLLGAESEASLALGNLLIKINDGADKSTLKNYLSAAVVSVEKYTELNGKYSDLQNYSAIANAENKICTLECAEINAKVLSAFGDIEQWNSEKVNGLELSGLLEKSEQIGLIISDFSECIQLTAETMSGLYARLNELKDKIDSLAATASGQIARINSLIDEKIGDIAVWQNLEITPENRADFGALLTGIDEITAYYATCCAAAEKGAQAEITKVKELKVLISPSVELFDAKQIKLSALKSEYEALIDKNIYTPSAQALLDKRYSDGVTGISAASAISALADIEDKTLSDMRSIETVNLPVFIVNIVLTVTLVAQFVILMIINAKLKKRRYYSLSALPLLFIETIFLDKIIFTIVLGVANAIMLTLILIRLLKK